MKNLFTNLAAFCLGSLICVTIIACANDIDDNSDNSIALLSNQIKDLSERLSSLEKNVGEIKEDMENIEDELDYEIVFQKFNSYFNGEEYKAEIDAIKEKLNSMSGGGQELPQLATSAEYFTETVSGTTYKDNRICQYEFDNNGRMVKITCTHYETDGDFVENLTTTYNISYSGNQCIIKGTIPDSGGEDKFILTFKEDEINNHKAVNHLIIYHIFNS